MMGEETVKPLTAEEYMVAYNTGYQAGLAKSQRDDDDAFWIRQYAGQAMQGMISKISWERLGDDFKPEIQPKYKIVAYMAVQQARALLEEVKKHEGEI